MSIVNRITFGIVYAALLEFRKEGVVCMYFYENLIKESEYFAYFKADSGQSLYEKDKAAAKLVDDAELINVLTIIRMRVNLYVSDTKSPLNIYLQLVKQDLAPLQKKEEKSSSSAPNERTPLTWHHQRIKELIDQFSDSDTDEDEEEVTCKICRVC
jgi:hypothetical protein